MHTRMRVTKSVLLHAHMHTCQYILCGMRHGSRLKAVVLDQMFAWVGCKPVGPVNETRMNTVTVTSIIIIAHSSADVQALDWIQLCF